MPRTLVTVDADGTDIKPTKLEQRIAALVGGGGGGGAYATKSRSYTAGSEVSGFDTRIFLDYNPTSGDLAGPLAVSVKDTGGTERDAFWLNEQGTARAEAIFKNEPSIRAYAHPAGTSTSPVLEVLGPRRNGTNRKWAISATGQPILMGSVMGLNVVALPEGDTIPAALNGVPVLIVRYEAEAN